MAPAKRLNLSKPHHDDERSSASSSGDEDNREPTTQKPQDEDSSSDDDPDKDFEIPPGFESVKGSGAMTREAVVQTDQELWFFKLPKTLNASALANVTIKVDEMNAVGPPGKVLAKVTAGEDNKKYVLQSEDRMLTDQLVNALPLASDRARFVLGKPFSRCFSLVEDRMDALSTVSEKKKTTTTEIESMSPVVDKRLKKHSTDMSEKRRAKKAKHKK